MLNHSNGASLWLQTTNHFAKIYRINPSAYPFHRDALPLLLQVHNPYAFAVYVVVESSGQRDSASQILQGEYDESRAFRVDHGVCFRVFGFSADHLPAGAIRIQRRW